MLVAAKRPRSRKATVFPRGCCWILSGGVMSVYRVFWPECSAYLSLQVHHTSVGLVSVEMHDSRTDEPLCVELEPDDIPALIAELRLAAKLAKEVRHG